MASKRVTIEGIGEVLLSKRQGASSIRLSVNPKGQVRISLPYWVPYQAGIDFVVSRRAWIAEHRAPAAEPLQSGQLIGKLHRLSLEASPVAVKISSRVTESIVRITHPAAVPADAPVVQAAATKASVRALRNQAETLLPSRLRGLAMMHGYDFASVQVKQLTGRWGSCDMHHNIVLNLYLMELPWTLIDYVLLHELAHTRVLKHGPEFWAEMRRSLPDAQVRRKAIRSYRPIVATRAYGQ